MATLSSLPSELIEVVCDHLDDYSVNSLRQSNRAMLDKCQYSFYKLFVYVKISSCLFSVEALDQLSGDANIAMKIEHITVGTEQLEQNIPLAQTRNRFWELYSEEKKAEDTMLQRMLDICRSRVHLARRPTMGPVLRQRDPPLRTRQRELQAQDQNQSALDKLQGLRGIEPQVRLRDDIRPPQWPGPACAAIHHAPETP
jgi:hypothetical protein